MERADDRVEFEAERARLIAALGRDADAFQKSKDAIIAADRHKYAYLWTWMGVPIIQLPADIMATQEAIWKSKPDVIVECGVARGGSVLFLASMLRLTGGLKVIGVDIDIRKHNRQSIEAHPMSAMVELVQGSSTERTTLTRVKASIPAGAKVMVILDSNHSFEHVRAELDVFAPLVAKGQYLVVADTLLGHLAPEETPVGRSARWEAGNEPLAALKAFLSSTARFAPDDEINDKLVFSSSPGGYVKCIAD
jgi:cephalosporin hydroxylase